VTVDGFESANGPAAAVAAAGSSSSRNRAAAAAAAVTPAQQQQQEMSMAQRMRLRRGSRGADGLASAGSTAASTEVNTPSSLRAAAIDGSVANAV
jgi:hypothetical protein